jgi:hypothetical protein
MALAEKFGFQRNWTGMQDLFRERRAVFRWTRDSFFLDPGSR